MQQPLMNVVVVVVAVAAAAAALLSRPLEQSPAQHCAFVGVVSSSLFVFLAVFVLVCTEMLSQRWRLLLGLIVWATHLTMGFTFIFNGPVVVPWDQVTAAALPPRLLITTSVLFEGIDQHFVPRCLSFSSSSSRCTPCCPSSCCTLWC